MAIVRGNGTGWVRLDDGTWLARLLTGGACVDCGLFSHLLPHKDTHSIANIQAGYITPTA